MTPPREFLYKNYFEMHSEINKENGEQSNFTEQSHKNYNPVEM